MNVLKKKPGILDLRMILGNMIIDEIYARDDLARLRNERIKLTYMPEYSWYVSLGPFWCIVRWIDGKLLWKSGNVELKLEKSPL